MKMKQERKEREEMERVGEEIVIKEARCEGSEGNEVVKQERDKEIDG